MGHFLTVSTNFAILTFGLSCSGHMSTMPVTRDSTMQNSESMPMVTYMISVNYIWISVMIIQATKKYSNSNVLMVTSMKKNTTAQTEPPGSFNTTLKMIMRVVMKVMMKNLRVGDEDKSRARVDNLWGGKC